MHSTLLAAVFLVGLVEVSWQIKEATEATEEVENLITNINEHCAATSGYGRRKRAASQKSEDKVRRLILNVVKDCLEETPPTYSTPPPTHPPVEGPCTSPETLNLTQYWRKDNKGSAIKPDNGDENCDEELIRDGRWFRITGAAGNVIRDRCPPAYSCGTHAGLWTNASMPTQVGQLINVPLYGSWTGNCNWIGGYFNKPNPLAVQRCSPQYGDFVYRIDHGSRVCEVSVCSMD